MASLRNGPAGRRVTLWPFLLATVVIVAWALTGPIFGFSDTWQLVINTGTTIVTFLMVFLIQNTQYRDTEAIQLKLDELLRAGRGARNTLIDLEDATDADLEEIRAKFQEMAERGKRRGEGDGGKGGADQAKKS